MNTTELQRLAASVHALRPDWPLASLRTFLEAPNLTGRAYRDVALALTWVACDASTRTPRRVLEPGPWWNIHPDHEKPNTTVAIVNGKCNRCGWFHAVGAECDPSRPADPDLAAEAARKAREAISLAAPPVDRARERIERAHAAAAAPTEET